MGVGYFLRVGDSTTCGGKILTGDSTFQWYGVSAAREGDMVSCGKHPGTYKVLGGIAATFNEGVALAGSLDSFSSCPCHAKFIPGISDSYSKDDAGGLAEAIPTIIEANSVMDNLWISFSLPIKEDYSGLNYRLTMDDGSVHQGVIDDHNKIYISTVSASTCNFVEIERPCNNNLIGESLTSKLLKNIMGD
ncbi:PAAR domain-containing protein [Leclercia barmai]|uniref:PAAR domain-containing protein n=1 Tax=Leclercia barmai TaxID=2785629 RepID=UPI003BB94A51